MQTCSAASPGSWLMSPIWPDLSYASWRDTAATLQLWTQIVGKVRLALTPWLNHSWQVPLYVTARGLGTSPIPAGERTPRDRVRLRRPSPAPAHEPGRRADTRARAAVRRRLLSTTMDVLAARGRRRHQRDAERDRRSDALPGGHRALHPTMLPRRFASSAPSFRSTASSSAFAPAFSARRVPVHFFWGSFDLAVTRFSGRPAPLHPGGVPGLSDAVAREAYSHEVSSAGFWPGSDAFPQAAFYSYAYPEPPAFATSRSRARHSIRLSASSFFRTRPCGRLRIPTRRSSRFSPRLTRRRQTRPAGTGGHWIAGWACRVGRGPCDPARRSGATCLPALLPVSRS